MKKVKKMKDNKSFVHAVISWDKPTYGKPLTTPYK